MDPAASGEILRGQLVRYRSGPSRGVPTVSQWSSFNRIRTAIGAVGLFVVLAVGVVVLAVPRPAGGAPARAASPVRAFAVQREAVSGPIRTILRLRLPRGLYAVNAKAVLIDRRDQLGTTDSSGCKLAIRGKTIDHSRQSTPDRLPASDTTHTLQFAGRLRGRLSLVCPTSDSGTAEQAKITAIRLTTLRRTP